MKKFYLAACLAVMLLLTSCAQLNWEMDLIGRGAVEAFERVINSENVDVVVEEAGRRMELGSIARGRWSWSWRIYMPDETTLFFLRDIAFDSERWVDPWFGTVAQYYNAFYFVVIFDPQPFIEAGLEEERFFCHSVNLIDNELRKLANTVGGKPRYNEEITPIDAFEQLIRYTGTSLSFSYHDTGHHYMLRFGNYNMLMFARDTTAQEDGIVLMLDPEPFIRAGVDVHNVAGWDFGPHEVMTARGKSTRDFLVKTFDLR